MDENSFKFRHFTGCEILKEGYINIIISNSYNLLMKNI